METKKPSLSVHGALLSSADLCEVTQRGKDGGNDIEQSNRNLVSKDVLVFGQRFTLSALMSLLHIAVLLMI